MLCHVYVLYVYVCNVHVLNVYVMPCVCGKRGRVLNTYIRRHTRRHIRTHIRIPYVPPIRTHIRIPYMPPIRTHIRIPYMPPIRTHIRIPYMPPYICASLYASLLCVLICDRFLTCVMVCLSCTRYAKLRRCLSLLHKALLLLTALEVLYLDSF
jgi:hypothetical protein